MPSKDKFMELIKREMGARGWKNRRGQCDSKALAAASGVHQATVSKYLSGQVRNLHPENLFKILKALNILKTQKYIDDIIKYPPWDNKRRDIETREMLNDFLMILRHGTPESKMALKKSLQQTMVSIEKK
jgi:transcriptional regulator with XRE-family HTH domain